MDGISLLDAGLIYSVLFLPLLTIALLLFWASANMKKTAKAQLLGIVILIVLGLLAINSPIILFVEAIAFILLVVWTFAYRNFFLKGQLFVIFLIFVIQVAYYRLFFVILSLENNLTIILLCIIPILSMMLLYPWTFGSKNTSNGRVFIIIVFNVQVFFVILNILISLIALSNS